MQYDKLAQDALRGVVRQALERAAGPGGLPGGHHFYITFRTGHGGCDIDNALLAKYPEEMTIVLEHQFWDLGADKDGFEVTLKFDGVPKYLRVPWGAVTRFHDPAVGFRLQFDYLGSEPDPQGEPKAGSDGTVVSLEAFRKKE